MISDFLLSLIDYLTSIVYQAKQKDELKQGENGAIKKIKNKRTRFAALLWMHELSNDCASNDSFNFSNLFNY
jgi:hypothetical protein